MTNAQFILLGVLAVLLIWIMIDDWRRHIIEDWVNILILIGAPLWWWANGEALWPDIAIHLAIGLVTFGFFTLMFMIGQMGGGDVKLLTALSLWFGFTLYVGLLQVMAVVGGLLTIAMLINHRVRKRTGRPGSPYGIAIAVAALWAIYRTIS
jgi:prepilin peptidase CpaA